MSTTIYNELVTLAAQLRRAESTYERARTRRGNPPAFVTSAKTTRDAR